MSHFTTINVQIKHGDILHQVLQELGYRVEVNAEVRGYAGDRTPADYVIRQANGYDFGFRKRGDQYELVTDLWGTRLNSQELINTISQKYAHKTLMATVQAQGFTVEAEEALADGTLRVVVGRWV